MIIMHIKFCNITIVMVTRVGLRIFYAHSSAIILFCTILFFLISPRVVPFYLVGNLIHSQSNYEAWAQ